ncbi:MAG: AAA family ATPase, partial [Salinivirgaceae bacterium]|nr:AAA family ATPase [Salinivirgaceae bacterium]
MRESIHIKNLGPIKDIFIQDIKPCTILIGESGSGKSTLMKAIALFRWIYKMHNIRSYLKHSNISKSPFRFRMETYLKNCGFEQFIKPETEILYSVRYEKTGDTYDINFVKGKLSGTGNADLIKQQHIQFNKISFISETRNIIPLWSDKGASLTGGYLGFYFHEVFRDFDLASDSLKELNLDFLNLKFAIKKTSNGKKYSIQSSEKGDYEIDFKNSSSGIQNSVPISLIAEYYSKKFSFEDAFNRSVLNYLSNTDKLTDFKAVKNLSEIHKKIFIHIEEPELSLFPEAQCQLMNDLLNKCFITNTQPIDLILSTHSPYIINHLNLLIKAAEKNTLIDGAKINFHDLAVYQMIDGTITDLKVKNKDLVNTNTLSDTINHIYDK